MSMHRKNPYQLPHEESDKQDDLVFYASLAIAIFMILGGVV